MYFRNDWLMLTIFVSFGVAGTVLPKDSGPLAREPEEGREVEGEGSKDKSEEAVEEVVIEDAVVLEATYVQISESEL